MTVRVIAIQAMLFVAAIAAVATDARTAGRSGDMQEVSRGYKSYYKTKGSSYKHGYKKHPGIKKNDKKNDVCSIPSVAADYTVSASGVDCSSDPYNYVPCCAGNAVCTDTSYEPIGCFSSQIEDAFPTGGNPAPDGFCCLPDGADILNFVLKICTATSDIGATTCIMNNGAAFAKLSCLCCSQLAYINHNLLWATCGGLGFSVPGGVPINGNSTCFA